MHRDDDMLDVNQQTFKNENWKIFEMKILYKFSFLV